MLSNSLSGKGFESLTKFYKISVLDLEFNFAISHTNCYFLSFVKSEIKG